MMIVALAQINPIVGDIDGNTTQIMEHVAAATEAGANMVVFPELAITGYPPQDLLLKASFVEANRIALDRIANGARGLTAIVGAVQLNPEARGKPLLNTVAVCANGKVYATYAKMLLPTYDVFDESRYFEPGTQTCVVPVVASDAVVQVGMSICEDMWADDEVFARRLYCGDPIAELASGGAEMVVNIGASPFSVGKPQRRMALFGSQAKRHALPLIYVNQVGGNDDLVFDGASGVLDASGRVVAQAKSFAEDFLVVDLGDAPTRIEKMPEEIASVHSALVLGTRDYVHKCGFTDVVVGASGGIDSAVTAVIAAEALGADHVHLVAMPSRYSSEHSVSDARHLGDNLGISLLKIPISATHDVAEAVLRPHFAGLPPDTTEENMQARIRGGILMSLSNKFGWLLLTTGNKSELAVGYCTLYGDMCGGLAVLSDVPKTMVYQLAASINRNAGRAIIPENTITKPPSAELRDCQTDQDSLPEYDVLDAVLERYVERDESVGEIVASGFDEQLVRDVIRRVDRNEYKRTQAATGLKVTSRAFGSGRRMPIAAKHTWRS